MDYADGVRRGNMEIVIEDVGVTMVRAKHMFRSTLPCEIVRLEKLYRDMLDAAATCRDNPSGLQYAPRICAVCVVGSLAPHCPFCDLNIHDRCCPPMPTDFEAEADVDVVAMRSLIQRSVFWQRMNPWPQHLCRLCCQLLAIS